MVKKIVMSIIVVVLTSSLNAENYFQSEKILGLEIGASRIEANNQFSPLIGELNHEGDNIEFGIRIGAVKKEWRTLLVVNYFNSADDDQEYIRGLLEVDYFIMQDSLLKPFLGINVGYMNYQTTDIDESSFLYGGQLGVVYRVTKNIEIDLMYRYSLANSDNVDHIEGIIFGLNYIY